MKPKYAAEVPEFLLTPDKVETDFLGNLEFFDGMPSESTVQKTYDFLDLSRGVETFLNGMPAVSIYAFLEGLKEAGLEPGDLGITEDLADARDLIRSCEVAVAANGVTDGEFLEDVCFASNGAVTSSFVARAETKT